MTLRCERVQPLAPENFSRPFPPKTLGFTRCPWASEHESRTVRVLPCVVPPWARLGNSEATSFKCEHFRVGGPSGGGLCVSMKLHDRSTQQNTWCVRSSQRSGWSIIIKPAHGCTTFPPLLLSSVELLLYITHKKGRTFERVGPSWMGQPHPTCGCACMRIELVRRSVELEA
jgi:hypothetical protein